MEFYGLTDKGIARKNNQDFYTIRRCERRACTVVVLCDGMGGAQGGEIASELSDNIFTDCVFSKITSRTNPNYVEKQVLLDACRDANGTAFEYSRFDASLNGMGTTLVGGIVRDDGHVGLVNVGDSRAYRISSSTGAIEQITRDHSLVEDLVVSGVLTKEQARTHPQKNIITRALGAEPMVKADYYELNLDARDVLLLCSDGLTNYVADEEIARIWSETGDLEQFCLSLKELTYIRGAGDNLTMIVAVNR